MKYFWVILFFLSGILSSFAQESTEDEIIVMSFSINGNSKTKKETILRELNFGIGDTLSFANLNKKLGRNQVLLMNTGLFYHVDMNIGEWDALNHVNIIINVEEAWYIFPVPIFDLADRNFNVWWKEYNMSFKRVNYGLTLYHSNLTGRRDKLKARVQLGYTQKYELQYRIPYINTDKTIGLVTDFLFSRNKEVHYKTENSKQLFHRNDKNTLLKRYRVGVGVTYRPRLFEIHLLRAKFYQHQIKDKVKELNPLFFLNDKNKQRYFSLGYTYILDKRDYKIYPKTGYYLRGTIQQFGLGIFQERNSTVISSKIAAYFTLDNRKKWTTESIIRGSARLQQSQQAFYNNKALGYANDYLRGYEYYVIDGSHYLYLKNSLRYELLHRTINWKKAMPFKPLRKMPLRMYLTLNSDTGYVTDKHYKKNSPLSNRWLWSGGLGLDIIMYVDKMVRLEYSINHKKETDLYIHLNLFF